MNRGSSKRCPSALCLEVCFNEAPIHESGKFDNIVGFGYGNIGFNEAPIHESGKYAWLTRRHSLLPLLQ